MYNYIHIFFQNQWLKSIFTQKIFLSGAQFFAPKNTKFLISSIVSLSKRKELKILTETTFKGSDVDRLRGLCVMYPNYSMQQLALMMGKDIEEIFLVIKSRKLPYNWKL